MSIIFGPGVGKPPVNTPPDTLPDSTPNDKLPVVVQLVPGQVGNMLEFRDTAGAVLSFVDNTGDFSGLAPTGAVTLTPGTTARNVVQPTATNAVPLTVKAIAAQTVHLQDWQDSSGNVIVFVAPSGGFGAKGVSFNANPQSANYSAVGTDYYIPVDATTGPVTVTLPSAAAAAPLGRVLRVVKTDGSVNVVTVQRAGADTVNGGTSVALANPFDSARLESDAVSAWTASLTTSVIKFGAAAIGFLGAPAVTRQTNGTAAALAAITDANAKSFVTALSTALVNLGLLAAPG